MYILNHVRKNDIVITHDIGLASILLQKCAHVLSPRGILFTEETINAHLYLRYVSAKARKNGHYVKGPKQFQQKHQHHFIILLEKILSNYAGDFKIYIE